MSLSQIYPLDLLDETLDINATENYDLTVEMSVEGLAIAILDLLRGKYVMFRHYPAAGQKDDISSTLADAFNRDEFLKKRYRKVVVITPSSEAALVPSPLYDPQLKDDYYRFNLPADSDTPVYSNPLSYPGATVVFTLDRNIIELISSAWPGLIPWHHTRMLMHHARAASRASEERYVHLHIESGFITVLIVSDRQLRFCNSFRCSSSSEVVYFINNVFDKTGIKNHETLHVSGLIEPFGEMHLSILNFTESLKFASPQSRYSLSYVMNELPMHRWLNIFTAASCE